MRSIVTAVICGFVVCLSACGVGKYEEVTKYNQQLLEAYSKQIHAAVAIEYKLHKFGTLPYYRIQKQPELNAVQKIVGSKELKKGKFVLETQDPNASFHDSVFDFTFDSNSNPDTTLSMKCAGGHDYLLFKNENYIIATDMDAFLKSGKSDIKEFMYQIPLK